MKTGIVKYFNEKRHFGFIIETHTKKEYFAHSSNIFDTIEPGDEVTFLLKADEKGDCAIDVELSKQQFRFDTETDILSEINNGELSQQIKITTDNISIIKGYIPARLFNKINKHFLKYIKCKHLNPVTFDFDLNGAIPIYAYNTYHPIKGYTESLNCFVVKFEDEYLIANKKQKPPVFYNKKVAKSLSKHLNMVKCIKEQRKKQAK